MTKRVHRTRVCHRDGEVFASNCPALNLANWSNGVASHLGRDSGALNVRLLAGRVGRGL
jgi:hypothetical protein